MKTIQAISIWQNGTNKQGTILGVRSVLDNLKDTAEFQFGIYDSAENLLFLSKITMSGQDYINWNNATDINEQAYTWVASKLNLTITGPYTYIVNSGQQYLFS
jgi:hypothetical protein